MNNDSNKHAYLILCHNNFSLLSKNLQLLDDARNDIYIHVDKKSCNFHPSQLSPNVKNATLHFVPRISVNWGGFSLIEATLSLLKSAAQTRHAYYHLISGVDLPLKSQNYIHDFFLTHNGCEFIEFDSNMSRREEFLDRIRYYHIFQDLIGRNPGKTVAIYSKLEHYSLCLQKHLKIDRTRNSKLNYGKGCNWFSITHDLAIYIIEHERNIRTHFKYSLCADEMFLQSLVLSSPFKNRICNTSLRYIDWKRGNPYTFRFSDYDDLVSSACLFARKFDENTDSQIINKIFRYVSGS